MEIYVDLLERKDIKKEKVIKMLRSYSDRLRCSCKAEEKSRVSLNLTLSSQLNTQQVYYYKLTP